MVDDPAAEQFAGRERGKRRVRPSTGSRRSQRGTPATAATSPSERPSITRAIAGSGSWPGRGRASANSSGGKLSARSASRGCRAASARTRGCAAREYLRRRRSIKARRCVPALARRPVGWQASNVVRRRRALGAAADPSDVSGKV